MLKPSSVQLGWLLALIVLLTTGWIFAAVIFQGEVLAFRDAAHFHGPLYEMVSRQWAAGHVPLWNPYENLGQPLAGHPAAAVFYPGKLLWALPMSHASAYHLYIIGHLLLAALTCYSLARRWSASHAAAGLAAVSYAFSGSVLMQVFNVPFLVGAAWLPLAMLCGYRCLSDNGNAARAPLARRLRWVLGLGAVLALMVLGGDTEMAYLTGLGVGATALIQTILHRATWPDEAGRWTAVALAGVAAFVLSAIQVLPSAELASRSDRTVPNWGDLLTARLEPHTHHEHVYHFSVGPWRLPEVLWPNVAGRQYPVHRRWLEILPAEGRIWTPTLYLGVVPLVLALGAMRFRTGRRRNSDTRRAAWLTWLVVLAAIASFGYYGLGWVVAELQSALGGNPEELPVGGPFGGLYWLMTVVLPGFIKFRYPAKLWVIVTLGLSLLAARGLERVRQPEDLSARRMAVTLALLSLLGMIGALAIRPWWPHWMQTVPADSLFGPLDIRGAWLDLTWAFGQTTVVAASAWALLRWRSGVAGLLLVTLTAVDLTVANGWMIATAPREIMQHPSAAARAMAADGEQSAVGPPRVWRAPLWLPGEWRRSSSPDRLVEAMRWDRATLWPKYNLEEGLAVVEVHGTMMIDSWSRWLRRRHPCSPIPAGPSGHTKQPRQLTRWSITPPGDPPTAAWRETARLPDAALWKTDQLASRCWLIVEGAHADRESGSGEATTAACQITRYEPNRIEVAVSTDRPARLVLAEQFYPGWTARRTTAVHIDSSGGRGSRRAKPLSPEDDCGSELEVQAEQGVFRAVDLPPGEHRVVLRYRPRSVLLGAIISGAGWLVLLGWPLLRVVFGRLGRAR